MYLVYTIYVFEEFEVLLMRRALKFTDFLTYSHLHYQSPKWLIHNSQIYRSHLVLRVLSLGFQTLEPMMEMMEQRASGSTGGI